MKLSTVVSLNLLFLAVAGCLNEKYASNTANNCSDTAKLYYNTLYNLFKENLEWRSYKEMIFVTLKASSNGTNETLPQNVAEIVLTKSVVFLLIEADILKNLIVPWLSILGWSFTYPVEKVTLVIPPIYCELEGRQEIYWTNSFDPDVVELAAQRAVSHIGFGSTASYYATLYNSEVVKGRKTVFLILLCVILISLSLLSCTLLSRHIDLINGYILKYATAGQYHSFIVFSVALGSTMTTIIWFVWLTVVFVHSEEQKWEIIASLIFNVFCFTCYEVSIVTKFCRNRSYRNWLISVPLSTAVGISAQFLSFLLPFLTLCLLAWPLLTTATVLFAYSLSCSGYGLVFVVLVVAVLVINIYFRDGDRCMLNVLLTCRNVLLLASAMSAATSLVLVTGYLLVLLYAGIHQDTSSVSSFILGLLTTFGTSLVTYLIHKLLLSFEMKKLKRTESEDKPLSHSASINDD